MRVALGSFDDQRLDGPLAEWAQGFCGHRAMVFDEAGDYFGTAVVDAFGGIAIAKQDQRIVAGDLGNLALCGLPVLPQPCLMKVLAKGQRVASHVLAVWRHQANRAATMEVGDYDEQLRTSALASGHSMPRGMSRRMGGKMPKIEPQSNQF